MTLTLDNGFYAQVLHEAQDGRRIATGYRQDLRSLNRALTTLYAAQGATQIAVLSVPTRLTSPALSTTYAVVARGKVRVNRRARLRVRIYGDRVRARVTVGGQVLSTATQAGTGDAWAASAISTLLIGATIDADGLMIVQVEVQFTAAGSTGFEHVVLEELPMVAGSLPATYSETGFVATHDEAYATADDPVDVFQLQRLDDNERWARYWRGRRHLHLNPTIGALQQLYRLSSCMWRLDGPYVMHVPPHAEVINVSACVERSGSLAVEVLALTEFEQLEEVITARSRSVSSAGVKYETWTGLKCRPGEPCLVWLAYRSEVSGSVTTTLEASQTPMSDPHKVWCRRNATVEALASSGGAAIAPYGWCMVMQAEDLMPSLDPNIKNALGFSTPQQIADLACVEGISGATADSALIVQMSPGPSTGITRAVNNSQRSNSVSIGGSQIVEYLPEIEVRACGLLFLYGVFVEATTPPPTRQKLARPMRPPSAGAVQVVAARANAQIFQGTPAAVIRHGGNGRMRPRATPSGRVVDYAGPYLFCEGKTPGTDFTLWEFPLIDPNPSGYTSGLNIDTLYGQWIFMASLASGNTTNEEDALVYCRFVGGSAVRSTVKTRHRAGQGAQISPTVADAYNGGTASVTVPGSSPSVALANGYTQFSTWPSEGEFRRGAWDLSEVFSIAKPGSFPTILQAEIATEGGARSASNIALVVAGLHVWWGPRS